MELDNEELEATKKMKEKKCEYCDLVSGEENLEIKKLQKENIILKKKLKRANKVIDLITEQLKTADNIEIVNIENGKQKITKQYIIDLV